MLLGRGICIWSLCSCQPLLTEKRKMHVKFNLIYGQQQAIVTKVGWSISCIQLVQSNGVVPWDHDILTMEGWPRFWTRRVWAKNNCMVTAQFSQNKLQFLLSAKWVLNADCLMTSCNHASTLLWCTTGIRSLSKWRMTALKTGYNY